MTLQEIKAELEGYKLEDMDMETLLSYSRQTNNYCINLNRSAREMMDYDISGMPFGGGFVCDQVTDARRNLCSLIEAQAQLYSDFAPLFLYLDDRSVAILSLCSDGNPSPLKLYFSFCRIVLFVLRTINQQQNINHDEKNYFSKFGGLGFCRHCNGSDGQRDCPKSKRSSRWRYPSIGIGHETDQ